MPRRVSWGEQRFKAYSAGRLAGCPTPPGKAHTFQGLSCLARRVPWAVPVMYVYLSVGFGVAAQPVADDAVRATARQLGADGISAFQEGNHETALEKLEQAYKLFPVPTLGLWSARSLERAGKWVEAAERYRAASRMSSIIGDAEVQEDARLAAAQELELLARRIPTLTIRIEGARASDAQVTLNGAPYLSDLLGAPRISNPGTHHVVAVRGTEKVEATTELRASEHKALTLRFDAPTADAARETSPTPSPMPRPSTAVDSAPGTTTLSRADLVKPLAIGAVSLGVASLAVWAISSVVTGNQLEECSTLNAEHVCEDQETATAYNTAKTISTIGFWTGLVLTLGGAGTLWFDAARDSSPTHAPHSGWSTTRWVGVGVAASGVLALGAAGVFSLVALDRDGDSEADCSGNLCGPEGLEHRQAARRWGNAATASSVAGGVLLAAGTVLWLVDGILAGNEPPPPSVRHSAWLRPRVSPSELGLTVGTPF